MNSTVQKWGNSLGIRIPKKITEALHLHSGSQVEVTISDQAIIIKNKHNELDTMLKRINTLNKHSEIFDDNDNKGNEEW